MSTQAFEDFYWPQLGQNGVFESMRAYEGKIFQKAAHLKRLFQSCKSSGIALTYSPAQIDNYLETALLESGLKDAYLRICVQLLAPAQVHLNIMTKPPRIYPKEYRTHGVHIHTSVIKKHFPASGLGQIKSSNYLDGILAHCDIRKKGIFELLYLDPRGFVGECSTSNIFIYREGILSTPPSKEGLLCGITKDVVKSIAHTIKIPTRECLFSRHELYNAQEVCITNTGFGIMPVVNVDDRMIGNGKPGKIVKKLILHFNRMTRL